MLQSTCDSANVALSCALEMLRAGMADTAVDPDGVELDINPVTGKPLSLPELRHVQNNAFGFGGNNAISIFRSVS
ncbi:hypothetical protein ACFW9L_02130 [Streptomyces sp. NPDC059517]|uniref:hypothetical protein n=1 Tax=Streptomyces sp. NPDC059517 TaxID=3346855 RepID=UPI00367C8A13